VPPRRDPSSALQAAARARLAHLADPARAEPMRAYMKSEMPYRGVSAVPLRKACKELFAEHVFEGAEAWQKAVLTLWRGAKFREERYVAIELTGHKLYRAHQRTAVLPMYEEMIVTGAWWDYVDTIAIHRLGPILLSEPAVMKKTMLAWSLDADLWKRRSSILCQVAAKKRTDLDLLYRAIEPNLSDKEFFIRKAIGWALRAYAWVDAAEIARYVKENEARLSGLSRREAMKNVAEHSA
jgi:3-methyladenine DNA glycosylase AlkD